MRFAPNEKTLYQKGEFKMNRKIWLIAATVITVAGLIIFAGALGAADWSFDMLNTTKYETNTHEITDEFENIFVETDTADITFLASEDGKCKVVCFEETSLKHTVSVTDGTLAIKRPSKKWYEHIGINFKTPKITVYLPKAQYASLYIKEGTGNVTVPKDFGFCTATVILSTGDVNFFANTEESLKIKTSTGKISVSDIICGDVALTVSTGKTEIKNVKCKNLSSEGDTGRITLEGVIAEEKLSIERSTGDVTLDACDASEIDIETDTGDVEGTLLSEKIFLTETDTGSIDVPKSTTGGKCEIKTDTGDIKIGIRQ